MAQLGNTIVNGALRVIGDIKAPTATTTSAGLMSAADKTKLDGLYKVTASTTDIGEGATLASGTLYIVYEE